MKDAIVDKLRRHLLKPMDDESWPVYLLAEIRKLREKENWLPPAPALKMCCHWALHVDLTHSGTVRDFFEPIERWISNTVAGLRPAGTWTFQEEQELFREFLFLSTLKDQLREALIRNGLPTELCDEAEHWNGFLSLFSSVIEDGSLTFHSASSRQEVSSIMFSKGDAVPGAPLPFVVRWDIALSDGRWATLNLIAMPTGSAGVSSISHSLHIC